MSVIFRVHPTIVPLRDTLAIMKSAGFSVRILGLAIAAGLLLPGCPAGRRSPSPARETPVLVLPVGDPVIEGTFDALVRSSPENRPFRVLVDLTRQVDLLRLVQELRQAGLDKKNRRRTVIESLESVAKLQQQELQPFLDDLMDRGVLGYIQPVAIVNRLIVEGNAAGILELSRHPAVASILPDWTSEKRLYGENGRGDSDSALLGESFTSWGVDAIGAPALWRLGLRGQGVVVAAIDTGVFGDHEQLQGRMLPERRGWFDPVEGRQDPYDNHGHGTSVLSMAVGGNVAGKIVGVAPEARWAVALGNWNNFYSRSRMTLAADWVLRTVRPDVVINAWSDSHGDCSSFDLPFINAWKAAGMFVVFPAGNAGPGSGSDESPANLSGTVPYGGPVFSTGGLERSEFGLQVFANSSRGPNSCAGQPFPSIAAPGAGLPFAYPPAPAHYGTGNGTSLAAGLVGGAAALLIQADPELTPEELETILIRTARDLPPEGHDSDTGAGILDLPAALHAVRSR